MTTHPDHITLELPSGKSHWTGVDASGKTYRMTGDGSSWRLHAFGDLGVEWWFPIMVQWDILLNQDTAIQRRVEGLSPAGKQHITDQFTKYAGALANTVGIPLPKTQCVAPRYVLCSIYIVPDPETVTFTPDMFPADPKFLDVQGSVVDASFHVQPYGLKQGCRGFLFATACPPGVMKEAVKIGLPKRLAIQSGSRITVD